jgi:hypothetical protein
MALTKRKLGKNHPIDMLAAVSEHGVLSDFSWDSLTTRNVGALHDAWLVLPETLRLHMTEELKALFSASRHTHRQACDYRRGGFSS